jgi:hypothetical protein
MSGSKKPELWIERGVLESLMREAPFPSGPGRIVEVQDPGWEGPGIKLLPASWAGGKPMAVAPKDRAILVWCPGASEGLPDLFTVTEWHEDGGWCVDELREPEMWWELPEVGATREEGA